VAGWADLWVDGHRIRSGDSVGIREGTLLRLNPLEPVVFGEYWEGVLSSKQWVNGRMRRVTELPPPLDLFAALGQGAGATETGVSPTASSLMPKWGVIAPPGRVSSHCSSKGGS